jgi:hypothetical protein
MAIMLSKTYAAFKAAGVPDEQAEAAAEELAGQERRFAKIEADLFVLKWMVAGIYGVLTIAGAPSVWLLLRVAAKVGALT